MPACARDPAGSDTSDCCAVRMRTGKGEGVLTRRLRGNTEPMTPERVDALRRQCRTAPAGSMLEALRIHNQDLLSALEDLQGRQDNLVRANAELEETNRGVLALHTELSEELEQTNQGVVALYAELDEATRRLRAASESTQGSCGCIATSCSAQCCAPSRSRRPSASSIFAFR